jgi:hypothetical protein
VVLRVTRIDGERVAPDEDSKESDAWRSLDRLGSIAYLGTILPDRIEPYLKLEGPSWEPY